MALSARNEAEAVLAAHRDKMTENEKWAVIEQKWLDSWIKYTGLNFDTGVIDNAKATGPRPGPIDNTRLAADDNVHALRMGVQEHEDYGVITDGAWDLLQAWYGGGPVFKRTVITVGIRKMTRLELFPFFVALVESSIEDGSITGRVARILPFGPKATAQNVLDVVNGSGSDGKEGEVSSRLWMYQEPAEVKEAPKPLPKASDIASLDTDDDDSGSGASSGPNSPSEASLAEVAEGLNIDGNKAVQGAGTGVTATSAPVATPATEEPGTVTAATSGEGAAPSEPAKKVRLQDGYMLIETKQKMEMQLEALGASRTSAVKMLLERQRADGSWPRAAYVKDFRDFEVNDLIDACDTVKKWYESIVRSVKPGQVRVHFIGWADTWDEWLPVDSDRLAPKGTHATSKSSSSSRSTWNSNNEGRPGTSGAVGLINLGNTCFMNSTLACLGHSPLLIDYFLDDTYLSKINRDNPLGWKGRVADEYGGLLKDVWSDKYTAVSPTAFKEAIGQFAPRFSGYQQQDSSELLSFLLDGLHEDLNQVKKKPFTPSVDSNGREDHIVAGEAWDGHLKRNQSVIVDLMQGQLKSRLECPIPECKKVSVTFDPFMFLSVPLPSVADKVQDCVVMWADRSRRPVSFGVTVSAVGRMSEFKKALSELSGVPANRLAAADLWNGRVYKMLDDETSMSEIRANDHLYCYEMLAHDFEVKDGLMQMAVFHQKVIRDPHYDARWSHSKEFTTDPVGLAHVVMIPRRQHLTNREVRALVRRAVVHQIPEGADLKSPELKLVVMDADGRHCSKHGHTGKCIGCELPDDDEKFESGDGRECNVSIAVQWGDPRAYNGKLDGEEKGASGTAEKGNSVVKLSDCIKSFAKLEVLGAEDPWRCPACKDFRQASKKMDIWKLPTLLVVHLKRFSYTRTWRDKIDTFVDFPIDGLDMSEFCVNPEFKGDKSLYDLYGVSNHYGGMGGGHYTAYVRNLTSGKWFNHDDSRVSPAKVGEIKSDAAYVLFYVRRGQAPWHKLTPSSDPASAATTGDDDNDDTTPSRTDGITISADRGGNSVTLYRTVGNVSSAAVSSSSSSSSRSGAGVGGTSEEGRPMDVADDETNRGVVSADLD